MQWHACDSLEQNLLDFASCEPDETFYFGNKINFT